MGVKISIKKTPSLILPLPGGGNIIAKGLLELIESYRTHFPEMPPDIDFMVDSIASALIDSLCPKALPAWRKAGMTIARHRRHHGPRGRAWLAVKLLLTRA